MKTKLFRAVVAAGLAITMMLTTIAVPTNALAKTKGTFKLSKKNVSVSKDTTVVLTSYKKNDKITITVQKPEIASVAQTSQKGKKTTFTISPKQKGSTKVIFRSGKSIATLKVKVTKTSFDTIRNGLTGRVFANNMQGGNYSVSLIIRNHTGLNAYISDTVVIHGDQEWDGHYFDPATISASQFASQYVLVSSGIDKQLEFFDSPVYGLRYTSTYAVMTFLNASPKVTFTVYFDEVKAENAYTVTVDENGVTSIAKQ